MNNNSEFLKTLRRGLEILRYLANHPKGLTNKETADHFGMDPSSSFRFFQTLVYCHFVYKENGKYYLSHRLLELLAASESGLIRFARPLIQLLAEELGYTAGLAVLENFVAVPVILGKGKAPLSVNSNLGKSIPLHASALGKVLLAYLSDIERKQILETLSLPRFTQHTITDRKQLCEELATIRNCGYSSDDEEYLIGVRCIAVPLLDSQGRCHAGISVSCPSQAFSELSREYSQQTVLKLKETAEQIAEMFYNPD